jgi:hypothetical protein
MADRAQDRAESPVVPSEVAQVIRANRASLSRLLLEANRHLERGKAARAAIALETAAGYAWHQHPGAFRSVELERLVQRLANTLELPERRLPTGLNTHGNVLHVLTQAYTWGGHTRLARRWISLDVERRHSVVLTGQGDLGCPPDLVEAVRRSGGSISHLAQGTHLERALELRALVRRTPTLVILHTHPYDIVPTLALVNESVRVVLLNHADHVFWVGASLATVVAEIRPEGARLSKARRGVDPAGVIVLPIPLEEPKVGCERVTRESLGIPPGAVVLLSIASVHKYGDPGPGHFTSLHREFFRERQDVVMLVIGPDPTGIWAEFEEETGGRCRALGVQGDVNDYYRIADVYVDSSPVGSLTSVLDAALRGVPTISFAGRAFGTLMSVSDPSLPTDEVQFRSLRGYLERLVRLVESADLRQVVGDDLRMRVESEHVLPEWGRHLERVYDLVDAATDLRPNGPWGPDECAIEASSPLDLLLLEAQGTPDPLWRWRLDSAPRGHAMLRLRYGLRALAARDLVALRQALPAGVVRTIRAVRSKRLPGGD